MKHIFISIISLVISIIAIALCTIQVTPSYSINEQTYIGIIATLIGVLVTFVVGYQILNTLTIKDEMREFEKKMREFEEKTKKIDKLKDELYLLENKLKENFELSSIQLENNKEGWTYSGEGFKRTHKMLIYSLNYDRDNYIEIFELLRTFISGLDTSSLFGPDWHLVTSEATKNHYIQSNIGNKNKLLSDAINEYNMEITKDQEIIRNHANFRQIRSDYERIMNEYLTRIEEYRNHPS